MISWFDSRWIMRRGVRATHAFRADGDVEIRVDLIELVRPASAMMRRVGDHPQLSRPGNHRADPTSPSWLKTARWG